MVEPRNKTLRVLWGGGVIYGVVLRYFLLARKNTIEPWLRQKFVLMSAELEFSLRFHVHGFIFSDRIINSSWTWINHIPTWSFAPKHIPSQKERIVFQASFFRWPGISMARARADVNLKPLKQNLVASVLEVFPFKTIGFPIKERLHWVALAFRDAHPNP